MDNFLILERLDLLERMITANKEVLTFEETWDYTGISRSYLYKLTAAGHIPHSKPNGKPIFFEKKKIVRWLLRNGAVPRRKYRPKLRRRLRETTRQRFPLTELLLSKP